MPRNTIILTVLGILVLGAAAFLLFGQGSDGATLTATGGPTSAAEQTFLNLAAQLDPVAFDTSILDDPRFKALVNLETAIVNEPEGRADPFAPLPGVSAR